MPARPALRRVLVLALIGLAYLGAQWIREGRIVIGDLVLPPSSTGGTVGESRDRIEQLFADKISDALVQVSGAVERVLGDDNEGSRHQRFIVELASGHTVLVAHNIDLASRVPLRRGDRVEVKGEYEWTELGGVIHWTHRDPRGRHEHGWIRHQGEIYQ